MTTKTLVRAVATVAVAAATALSVQLPAGAAVQADRDGGSRGQSAGGPCGHLSVCLYSDSLGEGRQVYVDVYRGIADLGSIDFNDTMSSFANLSGRDFCWYYDTGFRGEVRRMQRTALQNVAWEDNDETSSVRPC